MTPVNRQQHPTANLKLPDCPTPRTGEEVVWYTDAFRRAGTYVGYGPGARPIIQTTDGLTVTLESFDELRLLHPFNRKPPIWSSLLSSHIVKPHEAERQKLQELLQRRIPPGPRYIDLIEEIWSRGYETFVVGGTVRDIVSGGTAHDVDLVTSLPLRRAVPLLSRMYRSEPSIDEENGYVRLGGPWKDGAPFIDLKSFVFRQPGGSEAVFSANIERDTKHRDFACNAIYYDPINDVLLDPSGVGLHTAEAKELRIVCDPEVRPPYFRATIAIRFIKFCARGFSYSETTAAEIRSIYLPELSAMKNSNILSFVQRQVLNKIPTELKADTVQEIGQAFHKIGAGDIWNSRVAPMLQAYLQEGDHDISGRA